MKLFPQIYKIEITSHHKSIIAREKEILADKIQEAGIPLNSYCNKKGLCGKCMVEIVKGELPPLSEKEAYFLKKKKLGPRYRLACLYGIKGNLEIRIPEESLIQEMLILTTGIRETLSLNPAVKKYFLKLKKPEIKLPLSLIELVEKELGKKVLITDLGLLKDLPRLVEKSNFQLTIALKDGREIIAIEEGDTAQRAFGLAIDIGTTTLVTEVVDIISGESLGTATSKNGQAKYGADVVSRISFAYLKPENLERLNEAVLQSLNEMIANLLWKKGIKESEIYEVAIAGNTSMNHFFLGIPVESLAVAPFYSVFTHLPQLRAGSLGLKINQNARVYISPNIQSFVGGDISAGLVASGFEAKEGNFLYIDLGTNGEIVLKKKHKFLATSTAAGPAFEGMNISCGMLALSGAIYKAEFKKRLVLKTINEAPPLGICGTGLIDLIAILIEQGKISPKGNISHKEKKVWLAKNIFIDQKDVRELQLAVAAIRCGIRLILKRSKLRLKDLDGILIAGAFGNYLNIENSMKIGLLPSLDANKITFIGNASLAGARAFLLSPEIRKRAENLVRKIEFFSPAADPLFQEYFIDSLELKPYDS